MAVVDQVDGQTARRLSDCIAEFYHFAALSMTTDFTSKVLHYMGEVSGFDGACWLTFTSNDVLEVQPAIYLYQLPDDFWPAYQRLLLQHTTLNKLLPPALTENTTMAMEIDIASDNINHFLSAYHIAHQSIQLVRFEHTNHLLCLFSQSVTSPFDQQQVKNQLFLLENAARAFEFHLQLKLTNEWYYQGSFKAITDLKGRVLASDPNFDLCMTEQIPQWQNSMLTELIGDIRSPAKITFGPYMMRIEKENGICAIELYPFEPLIEKLSAAEIDVAKYLLKGLSVQQIAQLKQLSSRTIANQQTSIYKKLEVSKNADLAYVLTKSKYQVFLREC